MSTLGRALRNYGWKGLIAYLQIKTGLGGTITLPGIRNKIHLRKKTADVKLFKQLMIYKDYQFKSPLEPKFIVDGGANIGLSSVFFASAYPEAEIVAVEAEKNNYNLLCKNTINYPNIKCINAGLWHRSATLEVSDSAVESTGFMVTETSEDNPNGFKAISTQEILEMHNRKFIDLYKVDIEGAEKELLSDSTAWLSQTKILIIELHDRKKAGCSNAFFKAFHNRNFECHPFGQNFLLLNKDLI